MATGTGVYFDGKTSARREVAVEAAPDALRISAADGTLLAEWPYPELVAQSGARRRASPRPQARPGAGAARRA